MNILDKIGKSQMEAVTEQRSIPEFGQATPLKSASRSSKVHASVYRRSKGYVLPVPIEV